MEQIEETGYKHFGILKMNNVMEKEMTEKFKVYYLRRLTDSEVKIKRTE